MNVENLNWLVDWALRSSLLVAAAGLAVLALRKRPASLRHALWTMAIVGSLAMPLLASVLPAWGILPARVVTPEALVSDAVETGSSRVTISLPDAKTAGPAGEAEPSVVPLAKVESAPLPWAKIALWVWAAGASLLSLRLLLGQLSLTILVRRSRERVEIPGRVKITSHQVPPMVCGLLRPTILLPEESLGWPEERLNSVLQHEYAHIGRGDLIWGWAARLLCAAQWFNPLAWIAAARMRSESEHACDDAVIDGGVSAKEYAGHLLEIASNLEQAQSSLPAAAMASGPEVEGRLRYALDSGRRRGSLGKGTAIALTVLIAPLALAVSLADEADEPVEKEEAKVEAETEAGVAKADKKKPAKVKRPWKPTIVLDPGHGGIDSGSARTKGKPEKELTLKLALSLRERLEKAGFRVVLTRFDDSQVSLAERAEIANRELGGILLSLHFYGAGKNLRPHHQLFTHPDAKPVSERLSDSLSKSLGAAFGKKKVVEKAAPWTVLRDTRIGAVFYEPPFPAVDKVDASLKTMADALADGITAWSKWKPEKKINPQAEGFSITGDSVDYDGQREAIVATGKVEIVDEGLELRCDRLEYKMDAGVAQLEKGSVKITDGPSKGTTGTANKIEFDQNAGLIKLSGDVVVRQGAKKIIGKTEATVIILDLKTGKLRINGPSLTKLVLDEEE